MIYIIAGLAVYKAVHILDVLTPKEAMPWVKILAGVAFGYGASFVLSIEDMWTSGLVVATLAGACHGVLRMITLVGDMSQRKSLK
jgi:predicted membrane protein